MTRTVLVLGDYRQTLQVVRSLASAGWTVVAGVDDRTASHVRRSNAVDTLWHHPPVTSPRFGSALADALARHRPDVVFPVGDAEIAWISEQDLTVPVAAAERSVVEACQDKSALLQRAAAVGVPFTESQVVMNLAELRTVAGAIGYPVIVKSHDPLQRLLKSKGIVCPDAATLEERLGIWPDTHSTLIVQRYFEGERHNLYFSAHEGEILGHVEVVIGRTDRLDGTGYAVDGRSVETTPAVLEHSAALVADLKYTGVGCTQFLVGPDGDLSFLELNPRLGANFAVVAAAGLDLAVSAVDLVLGDDPAPASPRAGVRYSWTTGDLRGIKRAFLTREIGFGRSLRWLARAMRDAVAADVHVIWSWRDPRPALSVLWQEFGAPVVRRVLRRR